MNGGGENYKGAMRYGEHGLRLVQSKHAIRGVLCYVMLSNQMIN